MRLLRPATLRYKRWSSIPFLAIFIQLESPSQSTIISMEGYNSEKITLSRRVRLGCPLSFLLFALALEPFAIAIRKNTKIKDISVHKEAAKIALYADDIVCFLEHPLTSITELCTTIKQFGKISGYKINIDKSIFLDSNFLGQLKQSISEMFPAKWCVDNIKFLGIKISKSHEQMVVENINPIIKYIQDCCKIWGAYNISWLGRVAVVKMVLPPKLILSSRVPF